jgi:hypothetical protein
MKEIDAVSARIRTLRTAPVPFQYTTGYAILFTLLCLTGIGGCLGAGSFLFAAVCLDLLFVAVPYSWNVRIKKWHPAQLEKRLSEYAQLLSFPFPEGIRIVPSLRFDETAQGEKLPEDFRMMIDTDHGPDNLVGAQFQIAHNTGPNGTVPYVYAVIITKEDQPDSISDTLEQLASFKAPGFVTDMNPGEKPEQAENGKTIRYGSLVIRQDTDTRTDGYHTRPEDVNRLVHEVIRALQLLEI